MTTAKPQQRQFLLFSKFSSEVRPSEVVRRDGRIRSVACPFEEIAESEEEDIQLPERTSPDGRSPFAIAFKSPFAERRPVSPQNLSPIFTRRLALSRLGRDFPKSSLGRRQTRTSTIGSVSPDRLDAGMDSLTLPPIPEVITSSPDYRDDCEGI